jgi:hypothetical protein
VKTTRQAREAPPFEAGAAGGESRFRRLGKDETRQFGSAYASAPRRSPSRNVKIFLGKCRFFPLKGAFVPREVFKPKNQMAKKSARKPNAAFMKPVTPDATLAAVVGSNPLPRTELTKKLWAYIKKNGLQDKKVKTQINADDKLKPVFNGKSKVSMFEMTKLVSGHVS